MPNLRPMSKPINEKRPNIEPWRWHLDKPHEVARFAAVLRQTDRAYECKTSGHSMGDTLPAGSKLRFRCTSNDPHVGDVVVFLAGQSDWIAHRVVFAGRHGRSQPYLITRGDAGLLSDQPILRSSVLGIVEARLIDGQWERVEAQKRTRRAARLARSGHFWAMRTALWIHIRVAVLFAAASARTWRRVRAVRVLPGTNPIK